MTEGQSIRESIKGSFGVLLKRGLGIKSGEDQAKEQVQRRQREGLTHRDRTLPIRQNIIRVYNYTPELRELGNAYLTDQASIMESTFQKAVIDIKKYYHLKLKVLPDEQILKITRNPDNKATLKKNTIFMAKSTRDDIYEAIEELVHELGAFRLIKIYGKKWNIPGGLPGLYPEDQRSPATHYLDEMVLSGGKKDFLDKLGNLVWTDHLIRP